MAKKTKSTRKQRGKGINPLLAAGGVMTAALPALAIGIPYLAKKFLGGRRKPRK